MSLRNELSGVLTRDPRYSIHAYAFVFEALEYTKNLKRRAHARASSASRAASTSRHVTGRELCEGARRLALEQYGLLALTVLQQWGLQTTSDLGEIVYHLITSGDLEKTPTDSRSDFDDVFDFEDALRRGFVLTLNEVT